MKTPTYNIVEIFQSIEGEGRRVGLPVTFIRLYGCNLRCTYCDTLYGVEGNNYTTMDLEEIVDICKKAKIKNITITGGEPLVQPNIEELINVLILEGFNINIETNGAVDISPYLRHPILLTVDYKCPSSGMEYKMCTNNFYNIRPTDVVKFVVGSEEDLEAAREVILNYNLANRCQVYFSPVFGSIEPRRIVEFILSHDELLSCYTQLQLHKFIWEPDKRGV